jgi:hypothetical protein
MTATTPPRPASIISDLRPHCGDEIEVTTATGVVTGTLFSVCTDSVWLIVDGMDRVVALGELRSHRLLERDTDR